MPKKRQFRLTERADRDLEYLKAEGIGATYTDIVCQALIEKAARLRNPQSKYAQLTTEEIRLILKGDQSNE